MNKSDAWMLIKEYYNSNASDSDALIIEAVDYLLHKHAADDDTCIAVYNLASYYYAQENYLLAKKYYEIAHELGDTLCCIRLGDMCISGLCGETDYKKAYEYYMEESFSNTGKYKIAEMYRYGYYVKKDMKEYERRIRKIYDELERFDFKDAAAPAVCLSQARIFVKYEMYDDAINAYFYGKEKLARRLSSNDIGEYFELMRDIILGLYQIAESEDGSFDFYDLYEFLRYPVKIQFYYGKNIYCIEAYEEESGCAIKFCDKYYRSAEDFIRHGKLDEDYLINLAKWSELTDFCIVQ